MTVASSFQIGWFGKLHVTAVSANASTGANTLTATIAAMILFFICELLDLNSVRDELGE